MFGLRKQKLQATPSATLTQLKQALDGYIAQAIADGSKELHIVLQELASAGIVQDTQQRIIQRIVSGRGQRVIYYEGEVPCNVNADGAGASFNFRRGVETR